MKIDTVKLATEIRKVCSAAPDEFLPLHVPCLPESSKQLMNECIDSGWVSSLGKNVNKFEQELETLTGANKVIAVNTGTAALHTALVLAGVLPNDEVLLPSLTFVATANAAAYCGADCHFVEIEEETLGVDPEKLLNHLNTNCELRNGECFNKTTGKRIAALIVLHPFGHTCQISALAEICKQFHLPLVEDAAEAIGTRLDGKHAGTFGDFGVLSFNGNKTVTTGGGGAILVNDTEQAAAARHLTTTAKRPHPYLYFHDQVGFNYRMPNINAALGLAQLQQLGALIESKRKLAKGYQALCSQWSEFEFVSEPANCQSNYWLNNILLSPEQKNNRNEIIESLIEQKVLARAAWTPLHLLPMYQNSPRMDLTVTEDMGERLISLPSSPSI